MRAVKLEMKLGSDPKKTALLVVLLLAAAYFFYTSVLSSPDAPPGAQQARSSAKAAATLRRNAEALEAASPQKEATPDRAAPKEFRPTLKPKKGKEGSTTEVDPTLRLDLLAKLASVKVDRVDRSLFDFGPVQVKPRQPDPKPEVTQATVKKKKFIGPPLPPPPAPPPVKPPPPPIPLKFYGNAMPLHGGVKRVFCMQGEDILAPEEGDVIQKRYKIIKINATSVQVEDLDFKHQQTLPIEEPSQSG